MNLEDLAYALWLRSDLSRLARAGGHHDHTTSSRARRSAASASACRSSTRHRPSDAARSCRSARSRRVLLHHDFDVTALGTTIGLGSVHVVNPADPGATAFADVYRDFFDADADDRSGAASAARAGRVRQRRRTRRARSRTACRRIPRCYFARLQAGTAAMWVRSPTPDARDSTSGAARTRSTSFRCRCRRTAQQIRRAGGVAIWALVALLVG